jgi:UDP-glucose 4-epimerase
LAASGKIPELTVHGTDYPTADGTCERDYIHVVDLAKAHVAALQKSLDRDTGSYKVYNVSTGQPTSVSGLINTFEEVTGTTVPHKLGPRRAGDPVAYYATAEKIQKELGWKAQKTPRQACTDAWRWQQYISKNK